MKQRGDTIIEVLLAFAIFSMVSVGCMVVMGQGTNASQRALEITLVREQLDAQAEALRAAQQAFTLAPEGVETEWEKIAQPGTINDSAHFDASNACPKNVNEVPNSFIMDPRTATLVTDAAWLEDINVANTPPYAQMKLDASPKSYGMWIERTYHSGTISSYDFNVRACWFAAGLSVPMQLETTVRLYAPAS